MKVVCRVVCTGNNVADSIENSDPEAKYLALVENSSLLALISAAINDPTGGVAGIEEILKFVDRIGTTDVTVTEDDVRAGEILEVEVVMRVGGVAGEEVVEAGEGGGLSDNKTPISDRGVWLVVDASSSRLVTATGGPFWFPSGPGGPFLSSASPGAFVFTGPRAASDSRKDGRFVSL